MPEKHRPDPAIPGPGDARPMHTGTPLHRHSASFATSLQRAVLASLKTLSAGI